jgi:uncharacterized YigZ family protein
MKTILENSTKIYEINKSKFISHLFFVRNHKEAKDIIKKHNTTYKDASHNCYSYILDKNTYYSSDDGEPTGTAGKPMLNVLENNELTYTLAIVTRYYGGIPLGAGGLARAYSRGVRDLIKESKIRDIVLGQQVEIMFTHKQIKDVDNLLQNVEIQSKEYDEFVKYIIAIDNEELFNTLQRTVSNCKVIDKEYLIISNK